MTEYGVACKGSFALLGEHLSRPIVKLRFDMITYGDMSFPSNSQETKFTDCHCVCRTLCIIGMDFTEVPHIPDFDPMISSAGDHIASFSVDGKTLYGSMVSEHFYKWSGHVGRP
jgi:hypothetical protein